MTRVQNVINIQVHLPEIQLFSSQDTATTSFTRKYSVHTLCEVD